MNSESENQWIRPDSLVQTVINHYPQTITVFSRRRMHCVGCYIAPFHTIADTAREYALSLDPLLRDLNQVLAISRI